MSPPHTPDPPPKHPPLGCEAEPRRMGGGGAKGSQSPPQFEGSGLVPGSQGCCRLSPGWGGVPAGRGAAGLYPSDHPHPPSPPPVPPKLRAVTPLYSRHQ